MEGKKFKRKCFWKNNSIIEIDPRYFRPTEVNSLKGDFSLAKKELAWQPKININTLIDEMVQKELNNFSNDK